MRPKNSITVAEDSDIGDLIFEDDVPIGVVTGFQDDGRAVVILDGFEKVDNVPVEKKIEKCGCGSQKMYHENVKEWLCPFCEMEK